MFEKKAMKGKYLRAVCVLTLAERVNKLSSEFVCVRRKKEPRILNYACVRTACVGESKNISP